MEDFLVLTQDNNLVQDISTTRKQATREILRVKGGCQLNGSVRAAGAKNAITKLLVASLLSDKRCTFYNVPDIRDVDITVALCREIGAESTMGPRERDYRGYHTRDQDLIYSPEFFGS